MEEFVTTAQAVLRKGCSIQAIVRALRDGRLEGYKEGNRWRVSSKSLRYWVPNRGVWKSNAR